MTLARRALLVCLLAAAHPAMAQVAPGPPPPDPAPGALPPPETTVVAAPPSPGLDEDPHIDRVWFSPTAITQPAGTASFNDWELLLLGFTYGVSDRFQLSAFAVPPIVQDMPFIGAVSAKLGFSVDERVHLAVLGGLAFASIDNDSGAAAGLGGAISVCIDGPCASLVSAFVYGAYFFEETDDAIPVAYGVSLLARVANHVKLVLEAGSGGALARSDVQFAEAFVLSYGVRFFSGSIAGDVGFVRPFFLGDGSGDNPFVLGVPAVTISYRWGGAR